MTLNHVRLIQPYQTSLCRHWRFASGVRVDLNNIRVRLDLKVTMTELKLTDSQKTRTKTLAARTETKCRLHPRPKLEPVHIPSSLLVECSILGNLPRGQN